jgi:oxygen-independent coproporphyrinogen III oxidase
MISQINMSGEHAADPVPSPELIVKHGKPGPRYTSYPPAPYWLASYGAEEYARALAQMGQGRGSGRTEGSEQHSVARGVARGDEVSLYVHVPFCARRCTFCACNVVISRAHETGRQYVETVLAEMELALDTAGGRRPRVCQMHWGGGTPTWLSAPDLDLLCRGIAERFELLPDREQSIEVDPRVTTAEQLAVLRSAGLNRLSMGVQDFDPRVQAAIHRDQSLEETLAVIRSARALGITAINMDLVYGLPFQTVESFTETVDRVIELGADRVALYNFAYLPERLVHHKGIKAEWLPQAATRVELFRAASARFAARGYALIGLDHFAKGTDELSHARDEGTLQRNFMGYTTRAGRDLLAFGVSSISRVGRDFAQNLKTTEEYAEAVEAGRLPIERGLRLSDEDLARERAIQSLMCYGSVDLSWIAVEFGIDLLAKPGSRERLAALAQDGLVEWSEQRVRATALGRYFLRNIAMVFDAYLGIPVQEEVRGKPVQVRFSNSV